MRTTLDLDDDVLQMAKQIAANRGSTAGQIISELARKGLANKVRQATRNGVPLIPRRRKGMPRPTVQAVNRLRDGAKESSEITDAQAERLWRQIAEERRDGSSAVKGSVQAAVALLAPSRARRSRQRTLTKR